MTALDLHNETVARSPQGTGTLPQESAPMQFTSPRAYLTALLVCGVFGILMCLGIYAVCVHFPVVLGGQPNVVQQSAQPTHPSPIITLPVAQTNVIAGTQATLKNTKQIEGDFKRIQDLMNFNPHLRFDFDLGDSLDILNKRRDSYTDTAESQEKLVKGVIDDLGSNGFQHCDAMKRMERAWFHAYTAMVEDEKNWKFYSRMNMKVEAENARQDSSSQLQTMLSYATAISQCQFQE
jgi:hypothetical protein